MKNRLTTILAITLGLTTLTACGGGGGGDEFVGAATVTLSVQPSQIDSGDRAQVETTLGQVHENGLAVKFRFPTGLRYVSSSAFLQVNDKNYDITPTFNAVSNEDDANYLLFYLPQKLFQTGNDAYNGEQGTLLFQLVGRSEVDEGLVEVDPDVDDPQVDNSVEFDLANPEFVAEDEAPISVVVGK
jgi:hypothetical protein